MPELSQGFYSKLRQDIPEGEKADDGYCLRDALDKAGYDTELPSWIHIDDVPIVCAELELNYHTGKGNTFSLKKGEPVIIGHIVQRGGGVRAQKTLVIGLIS
jgi:hypothetical protein